uniref:Citrate transporter-like domain-containing protein n=1 Tax=Strigamia maritima TaxID=126957 RepID=T1IPD1_STRMM
MSAHHIPEITVTQHHLQVPSIPKIKHEKPLQTVDNWNQVASGSSMSNESSYERKIPAPASIQKYGSFGHSQLLLPNSSDLETAPLLPGRRKKSFGYRDKKFDDDVSIATSFYAEESVKPRYWNYLKIGIITCFTIGCVFIYTVIAEPSLDLHQYSIASGSDIFVGLKSHFLSKNSLLHLSLGGYFYLGDTNNNNKTLNLILQYKMCNNAEDKIAAIHQLKIAPPHYFTQSVKESSVNIMFDIANRTAAYDMYLQLSTNSKLAFPFVMQINDFSTNVQYGVIYASLILVGLYLLIIFEIYNKPSLTKIISWIDIETLCLLFGMMVMVAILCESGFFDYLAVLVFKIARGRVWTLLTLLCLATAVVSAFLDNVTTILLLTPVTIRLSEVLNLNPKYVLIALIIFSNVGGTATAGIEFTNFTTHMGCGVFFVLIFTYGFIMLMYRTCIKLYLEDEPEVVELKQEINVWKRAAKSVSLYSRDESSVRKKLLRKVATLENNLKKRRYNIKPNEEDYKASLVELEETYKIRDWPLLIKSGCVLICVIIMFFLHSIVPGINISLGWIALMGAILLLVLADMSDVEHLFSWIEWSTLIFFAALFVVMAALTEMGLLEAIGSATENFIEGLEKDLRLPIAIILVLWVSAIASSFIDNIPFTTVMIPIVLRLGQNPTLDLPLQPLVWALAFGACLGGELFFTDI